MALEYVQNFEKLVAKAALLAEKYNLLLEDRNQALAHIQELEAQLDSQAKELEKLRQEAEYMRMASVLAPNRQQIEVTRALISGLVREIDRCIADLTE